MTRQAKNIDIQQDQVNQIANDLVVVSEGSQILGMIFGLGRVPASVMCSLRMF